MFFWQDVLAALVFLAIETVVEAPSVHARLLYGAAVFYVAINVPVSRRAWLAADVER